MIAEVPGPSRFLPGRNRLRKGFQQRQKASAGGISSAPRLNDLHAAPAVTRHLRQPAFAKRGQPGDQHRVQEALHWAGRPLRSMRGSCLLLVTWLSAALFTGPVWAGGDSACDNHACFSGVKQWCQGVCPFDPLNFGVRLLLGS